METCCYIFMNNVQLCKTITEKHVQHFVHLIELHGRKALYIKFLQTIVKSECQYIKNCQDVVMSEVGLPSFCFPPLIHPRCLSLAILVGQLGRRVHILREGQYA